MKKIYFLLLLLGFGQGLFAQTVTKVTKTILPLSSSYPVVLQDNVSGGYHQVTDIAGRDALSSSLKEVGMLVWVEATHAAYQWDGSAWRKVQLVRNWEEGSSFFAGDLFLYGNSLVVALNASTIGATDNPLTDAVNWSATSPVAKLNSIAAADATGTIDNLLHAQTWNWSTATTQTALAMNFDGLTTGTGLALASSGAAINSADGLFSVKNTGAATNGVLAKFQANSTAGSGLTVLANGNVGIGLAAPTAQLHLTGGTASVAPLKLTAGANLGATQAGAIEYDGSHLYFTAADAGTRYQIDQQSGISAINDPIAATDVKGITFSANTLTLELADGASPGIVSTGAQTFGGAKTFNADVTANSNLKVGSPTVDKITMDGGDVMVADDVEIDGDLWVQGTLNTPSDERLKTKIETLSGVLDKINQMRGVRYVFKDQQKYASGPQVGVIAQELQKVFPELVSKGADGYFAVNYGQLTGVLIQAVKEQQQQIDQLKLQMVTVLKKLGLK